jgi:hypothetical protein
VSLRRVEVRWVDSMILENGAWSQRSDLEETFSKMEHRSCGYLYAEREEAIILAVSVYEPTDAAQGATLIPRVAILEVRDLEPSQTNDEEPG